MPWFRIDDTFADHPKVTSAATPPRGCGCVAGHLLVTLPDRWARPRRRRLRLRAPVARIDRLILARLWMPTDDGFVMPDFLDYNPSAEAVKLARKRDAEKKRRQRAAGYAGVDRDDDGRFMSPGDEVVMSPGGVPGGVPRYPSLIPNPDPSPPEVTLPLAAAK